MDGITLRLFTSDGTADGTIAGIFDGVKLGFNVMGDGDEVGSKIDQKEGKNSGRLQFQRHDGGCLRAHPQNKSFDHPLQNMPWTPHRCIP